MPRPAGPGRSPRRVLHEVVVLLGFRAGAGGRSPTRLLGVAVVLAVGVGLALPLAVARFAPRDLAGDVTLVSATLWAFVLLSTSLSAVASAGGREVLGRTQRAVLPVSPAADQLGALLLTPLNVAWSLQAVLLLSTTAYAVGWDPVLGRALLAAALWIAAATTTAQLLGWVAELARSHRLGVVALRVLATGACLGVGAVVLLADPGAVLDGLPTLWLFVGAVTGDLVRYAGTQVAVAALAVLTILAAVPVAERLAGRPPPVEATAETVRHARGRSPRGPFALAAHLDGRSVRRSPPLRRGLVLLLGVPLAAVALLPLPWTAVLVLPALVASGAALLHGVNLGALDGGGAQWRESLPWPPDPALTGRAAALAVVTGGAATGVALLAALRAAEPPGPVQLITTGCAVLVATAQVVSWCLRWSLRRPFQAELRSARDTPAPPLAMARYSLVLSADTTLAALLLVAASTTGSTGVVLSVTVLLLVPCVVRLARAREDHRRPQVRARVAATVAGS